MKQHGAVIKVMEENGGFATLGHLYRNVFKIEGCEWETKTPYASVRRIVQDDRFFFKIKPGLWALKSYRDVLPSEVLPSKKISQPEQEEFNHSYYQGLLVEVGNFKGCGTFVPNQDKNRKYLGKTLGDLISIKDFYKFSYENIIRTAQTVDVSWFNNRKMPSCLFEVEYTTNFQNSFLKFVELQDFNARFFVVTDNVRKKEFVKKLSLDAFSPIAKRVKFVDYEGVSNWYAKTAEIASIEKDLEF